MAEVLIDRRYRSRLFVPAALWLCLPAQRAVNGYQSTPLLSFSTGIY
jgi:hypothetical protein